ncbi:MAG: DUF1800 domain-containing protein [Acidobacteria bacterium]|nr:DUF1800 domain-containing protein [Acidobacteriota bacterium]
MLIFASRLAVVLASSALILAAADADWADDLRPIDASVWNYDRAAHLIERSGFGATPDEIRRLAAMSPEQAVDWIVNYESIDASALAEFDESSVWDPGMDPFPPSRAEAVRIARENGTSLGEAELPEGSSRRLQPVVDKFFYSLRANTAENRRLGLWWADRMVATPRPLEEKLTFFWHGHFATSETKVRDYRMMLVQNRMLRARASGSFRELLLGIMRDPAMLVYLDNGENVKDHPNENFGRELLELFTLGVGNYGEQDIREASRAFTGWTNDVLEFRFDPVLHDAGPKKFLGREGEFGGEEIVDIILEHPATAEFIAAKLYRFFVREEISKSTQVSLDQALRDADYQLKPLLKAIFLSRDFYSEPSVATQIKSPVQLFVSTYRKLGIKQAPTAPDFNELSGPLGQSLLYPPNVAGWAGGRTWITPATLLERGNAMRGILYPPDLAKYGHPDRVIPRIYAQVGERMAQGMNITNATNSGDSAMSMLADADEDYNTRYGVYQGYLMAHERVKMIPRHTAQLELAPMVRAAGAETAATAVDHLLLRFLRAPLGSDDRLALVAYLEEQLGNDTLASDSAEQALRSVLYLILSSPEYQLG